MSVASQASTSAGTAMEVSTADDLEKQAMSEKQALSESGEKGTDLNVDIEEGDNVVNWDGESDPENPQNWTPKKKWTTGGLLAGITFVTPLASSMFAPGVEDVLKEFHSTSTLLASFCVSIYILGYAVGPLAVAPLSEIYGRTPIYNISNVFFIIFTIACAVSSDLSMLIVFRFFAGVAGSTPITIGGGTFGDLFSVEERGSAMAVWAMGPLLGPVIGPVAGGFIAETIGWRWTFWIISIIAGLLSIAMFFFGKETYPVKILEKKAARLRKETGNPNLRSALTAPGTPKELFIKAIVRPMKMLLLSPVVLLLSLYMAFVYGLLYLLFTTITAVFQGSYGFSQGLSGLAFLGLGVGMMLGLVAFGMVSDKLVKKLSVNGVTKPEYRLPPMIPAAMIIPAGFFLYGWTTEYRVHWMAPIIGTALVGIGLIGIFMATSNYLIDAFTIYAASALAASTVLRSLFGCFLPLVGPPLYENLGLGWGNSTLGFIAIAMIPIPMFFWKYGEKLRTSARLKVEF